jgi:hypothetical protein
MTIKPAYLVTDMDCMPRTDLNMDALEYKTERAALKAASEALANTEGQDAEVWVWRLSHVLMKPDVDPVIERVK